MGDSRRAKAARAKAAAGLLALAVVAAACGGDDGGGDAASDEGAEFVEAILATNNEDEDEFAADLSEDEQECMARAMVDAIGVSQLQEATTPDEIRDDPEAELADLGVELDEEQAGAIWDGLNDCVDVLDLFLTGLAEDGDLAEEDVECLGEQFDEDFLKRLVVTSMVEGEDALDDDEALLGELFAVLAACPGAVDFGG